MHEAADSVHEEVDGGVGGVGDGKDDGGEHHPQALQTVAKETKVGQDLDKVMLNHHFKSKNKQGRGTVGFLRHVTNKWIHETTKTGETMQGSKWTMKTKWTFSDTETSFEIL